MTAGADPRGPFVLVVAGPTASGKSRLAMEIARRLSCEIVVADSMQVYRGLDIGTAKPTPAERREVPHHLLDLREPDQPFSAGDYVPLARRAIREIAGRGRLPLLVGGTGLYIRAALSGILAGPSRDEALREDLLAREKAGPGALHRELRERDPAAGERIPPGDLVRVVRALEVVLLTGKPLSALQDGHGFSEAPFRARLLVLDPPRPLLYRWIEERVEAMIEKGWVEEVRGLLARGFSPSLGSMKAVGYRELARSLLEGAPLPEAVAAIKTATRRYAKRQLTWFRAERGAEWLPLSWEGGISPLADSLAAELAHRGESP